MPDSDTSWEVNAPFSLKDTHSSSVSFSLQELSVGTLNRKVKVFSLVVLFRSTGAFWVGFVTLNTENKTIY